MLVCVPAVAGLLFFLLLKKRGWEWRMAVLGAAVTLGAWLWATTEALSACRQFTRPGVTFGWGTVVLAAIACFARVKPDQGHSIQAIRESVRLDVSLRLGIVGTGLIAGLVLLIALTCPPHTWDAMVYHLPRAVMWISNRSVDFYPTPDYQQLVFAPWAEYAMAHTMLLSGADRFVNLVEFISYLGCGLCASLVAKFLGAGIRGQWTAAITCLTIPTLILEASGPMNNAVVAFWVAASAVFVLAWNESQNKWLVLAVGLSAGLAVLTKGIAYIFLPWILLACWAMGDQAARLKLLKMSWIAVTAALLLNGPHFVRCYQLTGSPLGLPPPDNTPRLELTIRHKTLRGTAAGLLRNISLHLGTPSERVNASVEAVFRRAMFLFGADPDDPKEIWLGEKFTAPHFSMHEVHAGNPLHLALLLSACVLAVWSLWQGAGSSAAWLAAGLGAGMLFFGASLRWHTWMSRLHEPIFVLGAALIGAALERHFSRKAAALVTGLLVGVGLVFAASNRTRSLVPWSRVENVYHPRAELYLSDDHTQYMGEYLKAAAYINSLRCDRIAIDSYTADPTVAHTPRSFYVYPLMALIHADGGSRRVWYTGVTNQTTRYANALPLDVACAVACLECAGVSAKEQQYGGANSRSTSFAGGAGIVVFEPKPTGTNPDAAARY